ncbi:MAG: metalloenzyme [Ignavibacteriales bacterium]
MSSVLFIFLDGVGIGENDSHKNPFISGQINFLSVLFGKNPTLNESTIEKNNLFVFPIDANLDVDGLPQSGSGQTAIFTGENASKIIGRHFGPFPHSEFLPLLESKSIYTDLQRKNKKVYFANAYPPVFFEYLNSGKKRTSVSTMVSRLNNVKINSINELLNKEALTAEVTNHRWNQRLKMNLPVRSIDESVEVLLALSEKNDFTFYEYFLTDHFGHGRNLNEADENLNILSEFICKLINANKKLSIFISSDHGNIEDLSIKTHTRNPALGIAAGVNSEFFFNRIKSLTDIKKTLIEVILDKELSDS